MRGRGNGPGSSGQQQLPCFARAFVTYSQWPSRNRFRHPPASMRLPMQRLLLTALLPLLTLLAGCSLLGDSAPQLEAGEALVIQTEESLYLVDGDVLSVPVILTNRTRSSIYLNVDIFQEPFFVVQKKDLEGAWVTVYGPAVILLRPPPRELEAGESLSSTFWLDNLNQQSTWILQVELPGTYRFVVIAGTSDNLDTDDLLPLERRVSNEFEIVE